MTDIEVCMITPEEAKAIRAEIERLEESEEALRQGQKTLRAEIERLRAALEQAVDDFGEGHCVCEQTKQECIRALEPKP